MWHKQLLRKLPSVQVSPKKIKGGGVLQPLLTMLTYGRSYAISSQVCRLPHPIIAWLSSSPRYKLFYLLVGISIQTVLANYSLSHNLSFYTVGYPLNYSTNIDQARIFSTEIKMRSQPYYYCMLYVNIALLGPRDVHLRLPPAFIEFLWMGGVICDIQSHFYIKPN